MNQKLDKSEDLTSSPSVVDNKNLTPTKGTSLSRKAKERLRREIEERPKEDYLVAKVPASVDPREREEWLQKGRALGIVFEPVASPSIHSLVTVPLLEDGTPALWSERTTGRQVSPADFIRQHYGRTREDGTWDPMGLTRADLLHDKPLYLAFAQWLKRHPEDDFDPASRRKLVRYTDPEEAVARIRQQKRGYATSPR